MITKSNNARCLDCRHRIEWCICEDIKKVQETGCDCGKERPHGELERELSSIQASGQTPSNVLDLGNPDANMYGFMPVQLCR